MITCTQDVYGQCHLALWNETQPLNYEMQASARPSLSTRFDENSTATPRASIFVPFSEGGCHHMNTGNNHHTPAEA